LIDRLFLKINLSRKVGGPRFQTKPSTSSRIYCFSLLSNAEKKRKGKHSVVVDAFDCSNQWLSCHYVYFTSIEDIYLKSSIPGHSSILCVSGSNIALRVAMISPKKSE
jgi:hypothetical protein